MNGVLKCGDVQFDRLVELIEELRSAAHKTSVRCWIEALDGWSLDWWPGFGGRINWYRAWHLPEPVDCRLVLKRSYAGRIFAPEGEISWRMVLRSGAWYYRCVFLGQGDWAGKSLDDQSNVLQGLKPERSSVLLWGQQTSIAPGEWIELRVPHRFRYPVNGSPQRVVLEIERWLDGTCQPHFIRLCDIRSYEETN